MSNAVLQIAPLVQRLRFLREKLEVRSASGGLTDVWKLEGVTRVHLARGCARFQTRAGACPSSSSSLLVFPRLVLFCLVFLA